MGVQCQTSDYSSNVDVQIQRHHKSRSLIIGDTCGSGFAERGESGCIQVSSFFEIYVAWDDVNICYLTRK